MKKHSFAIPARFIRDDQSHDKFWATSPEQIETIFAEIVRKGEVRTIGHTAGGRPIRAYFLGKARAYQPTTTPSGAYGTYDIANLYGPKPAPLCLATFAGIHGSEFEGIAQIMNFISVLETGHDLKGKQWPAISEFAKSIDRFIAIPLVNVDGRARIPFDLEADMGSSNEAHSYLTTGAWADGSLIGWPDCKRYIPLPFDKVAFPGAYPNDAGVNIQHDDFFANPQPETRALLDLLAKERPDLTLNWHTGAPIENWYTRLHRPFNHRSLTPAFDTLYRQVHVRLTREKLQGSSDEALESDPAGAPVSTFNLDTVINLHSGALAVLVEQACHGFSGTDRQGNCVKPDIARIVDEGLYTHEETLRFIVETGGRCNWN